MLDTHASQVPVGTVLEGKFRVTQEIGRGGMAAVYEAENIDIGKRVAVKILSADLITSRIVRERFMREARAAAAIHSPYICEVYDSGMYHDRPFLIMELLQGESLYDRMTRERQLRASTTLKIMRHVVRGLAKAHEVSVVHRDLKPENIFLTRDAEGLLLAKIVDFGLAKFYEGRDGDEKNVRLTREGALFGTPAYMSPEQARGQGEVDHRADLWALGCIVYECLTGRTVWDVQQGVAMILAQIAKGVLPDPRAYRPDLPQSFTVWLHRALHADLNQRFQSARAFLESLETALPDVDDGSPSERVPSLGSFSDIPDPAMLSATRDSEPKASPAANSAGRAILWLVAAACIAFSGYVSWLYIDRPEPRREAASTLPASLDAPEEGSVPLPAERGPGAELINQGQDLLRADKTAEALQAFEAARGENPGVAISLINHTKVALDEALAGHCVLSGIGRPRPFDTTVPASHARIYVAKEGFLAAWSDSHQDQKRRNVYAALLDDALRRVGPVRNVTPESGTAIEPSFVPNADGYAVIYWDSSSAQSGVYVRALESDARIRSPAHVLTTNKLDKYYPSVTGTSDGKLLVVWSEKPDPQSKPQLVLRTLNRELSPEGDPVQLTRLASGSASHPSATVRGDTLYVAYRYDSTPPKSAATKAPLTKTEIRLLRVRLDASTLGAKLSDDPEKDFALGNTVVIREHPKQSEPSLVCNAEGCVISWDDETSGAFAAFVPHERPSVLWHREFSTKGKRPVLAESPGGDTALAYFAGDRLFLAPVTRDGIGTPSVVSRVSGFQPSPKLTPGRKKGEWLLAWRDFEAGHLEILVARVQCTQATAP